MRIVVVGSQYKNLGYIIMLNSIYNYKDAHCRLTGQPQERTVSYRIILLISTTYLEGEAKIRGKKNDSTMHRFTIDRPRLSNM